MNLERIADYELVEYLTAGGMADLYLARSPRHPGPVVLKTIQRKYVELTRVVKMFIDEGRIAKALDHPNIVRIYDVGEERGAYYIAMELINGRDLLAIARRGIEAGRFLPLHLAVAIVAQVANGLIYAHEKRDDDDAPLRIVHCDVSPGNVVVSFGGTAKIVDFGIARAAIQLRAEDHSVAGKFNYMAPEQIRGASLDARADIFSLGVILYELTVGRRLFRGRPADVKARVLAGKIPKPRDVRPELPEALEHIILGALASDPAARYTSARELREGLRAFLVADGRAAGKREIAEYLREIFAPAGQRTPARGTSVEGEAFAAVAGEDEEELSLEAPVPGIAEVVVDPEDPEPEPAAPSPLPASDTTIAPSDTVIAPAPMMTVAGAVSVPDVAPAAQSVAAAASLEIGAETLRDPPPAAADVITAPVAMPMDSVTRLTVLPQDPVTAPVRMPSRADTHPPASRSELVFAGVAVLVAVVLYLMFRA